MKIRWILGLTILATILYFILVDSPINAKEWSPPLLSKASPAYDETNKFLNQLELVIKDCDACEDVALDSVWGIVGGEVNGNIVRFVNNERTIIGNTGGRPLGMDIGENGVLYIADAYKGLLSIELNGTMTQLTDSYNNQTFKLTDDVEYFDSVLYFTVASMKYDLANFKLDMIDHTGYGLVLSFDLRTGQTNKLLDSLQFANGITVSKDGTFIAFTETGNYSIKKYFLSGPKSQTWEYLATNLAGFPDGISRGDGEHYWVTLAAPRNDMLEKLMPYPILRKQLMKLPFWLIEPKVTEEAMVLCFDQNGKLLHNLQANSPKFKLITSVEPYGTNVYFGSLSDKGIAKLDFSKI